ncbi:hypothetical protein KQI65_17745 [bacterium]|nr:hypothetical protein [bacterium]
MPHAAVSRVRVLFLACLFLPVSVHAQEPVVEPTVLQFGHIRHGGDRCQTLRIINRANTQIQVQDIWHPKQPFPTTIWNGSLFPGDTLVSTICFEMKRLGADTSMIHILFDTGGGQDSLLIPGYAFGWDSLSVGIGVTVSGKPGSVLSVPLRIYDDIPEGHDIRKLSFTIQFNKTLLYPLADPNFVHNSVVSGMSDLKVHVNRDYSRDPVTATFEISGSSPLINPATDSILFRPTFLVLQGNAMGCDLTLTHVRFSDGVPLGGAFLKGRFEADSICYQRFRLVDHPAILSEPEIGSFPNPASASMMLHCVLPREQHVRVTLHSMLGDEVATIYDGVLTEGDHALPVDVVRMPRGRYFCRILTSSGGSATSSVVLQ